jgi:hypothetical protein
MMQGGINNAALFGASQRTARSKLDQMAGIKRPSGILASSSELIQAAMPARPPMPPVMQQSPASMVGAPMVAPPMPAAPMMPMPTTVAPRPLNPMAGNPTAGKPVVQLNEGGFLDRVKESVNKIPGKMAEAGMFRNLPPEAPQALDITMEPGRFRSFLDSLNPLSMKFLSENIGDEDAIAQAAQRKLNNIEAAAKTKDPAQTADQVMIEAGEQPTDAAKIDFAENVFGLEDVNDIDEINRRIANVAIGSSVAKSPDEFAQAVLLGLQTFKQTASARAAGSTAAGGEKSRQEYLYKSVFDATYKAALENDPENPGAALAAARTAAQTAAPNAPSAVMGGQPAAAPTAPPADISSHQAANDAAKKAGEKIYTIGGEQFNVQ